MTAFYCSSMFEEYKNIEELFGNNQSMETFRNELLLSFNILGNQVCLLDYLFPVFKYFNQSLNLIMLLFLVVLNIYQPLHPDSPVTIYQHHLKCDK